MEMCCRYLVLFSILVFFFGGGGGGGVVDYECYQIQAEWFKFNMGSLPRKGN